MAFQCGRLLEAFATVVARLPIHSHIVNVRQMPVQMARRLEALRAHRAQLPFDPHIVHINCVLLQVACGLARLAAMPTHMHRARRALSGFGRHQHTREEAGTNAKPKLPQQEAGTQRSESPLKPC